MKYFISDQDFTVPQIAHILKVSATTVKKRMKAWHLSIRQQFSVIDDHLLDERVAQLLSVNSDIGLYEKTPIEWYYQPHDHHHHHINIYF